MTRRRKFLAAPFLLILICSAALWAQEPAANKLPAPAAGDGAAASQNWAPELLYDVFSSPNPQAGRNLNRAAFAAGPAIIPQLQAALKDELTSTFAAQSLAYIGGKQALETLSALANDSRNLGLRHYYFGALGEFDDPRATGILLDAIRKAGNEKEPDRAAAETAIIALTVHSDAALAAKLRDLAGQVTDVVIQDDLQNAADVIEARAKYMATPAGQKAGGSTDQTIRSYFMPAFQEAPVDSSPVTRRERRQPKDQKPPVDVRIENLTYSPDGNRALAHVIFETPEALANYEMVLQKKSGNWALASVWLGAEREKPGAAASSGGP